MWLWVFLILFFLTTVISLVVVVYSLKRINQYEQLLINIEKIIAYSAGRLKQIDDKGTFESDDEVGYFFEEVKKLQDMMNDVFETDAGEKIDE